MTDLPRFRQAINNAYLIDETEQVALLVKQARLSDEQNNAIAQRARDLILMTRERIRESSGIEALLHEYDLSSEEGVILMCLAEALLRIPDTAVADQLIKDKLGYAHWEKHLGHSHSLFVNASTWSLMLTGKLIRFEHESMNNALGKLLARGSEPIIRRAIHEAMHIIGQQFVLGESIDDALIRSQQAMNQDYLFSFDMLGEAALSTHDAQVYLERYLSAIDAIAEGHTDARDEFEATSISVKLTALHPRFEISQKERVMKQLVPDMLTLAQRARDAGIGLTIDAEESYQLDLTLDIFESIYTHESLGDWQGLGIAIQAYQKRAVPVLQWLEQLAQQQHKRLMIRLVKGAYWDSEIKLAQEQGLEGYPVYTRKVSTDVSYLACIQQILASGSAFYPQFATHNAYTIATIQHLMKPGQDYEFQRLHGMGETIYEHLKEQDESLRCRVYAPVGNHKDLLPYLVRRLLENGANTSFVNRIENDSLPVEDLTVDPVVTIESMASIPHPSIPLPRQLFGTERTNSTGFNFSDNFAVKALETTLSSYAKKTWEAEPLIHDYRADRAAKPVTSPIDARPIGQVIEATAGEAQQALDVTFNFHSEWANTSVEKRAHVAELAANLLEAHRTELMALCIREGGRCVKDSLYEVREAIDACRYYAAQARELFREKNLPGPTGEANTLSLHGRGVMCCISPWNFPVAIFTSQVIAALVAGNTVIAKPSNLTCLSAMRVVQLLHQAGVPETALCFLPGPSAVLSNALLNDSRLAGVIFTGSNEAATTINRALAQREGPIATLIAETGGQNTMIVDSSALPEQVVVDAATSAFNSAGQRCSALRVLFVQEEIADRVIELLKGYIAEIKMGDPLFLSTDVGPLIDAGSKNKVYNHISLLRQTEKFVCGADPGDITDAGHYLAPTVFEIKSIDSLKEEVFGPVLHIVRYKHNELDDVIASINNTGYGLTLGIHTRINEKAHYITQRVRAGNIYVNRNIIGAVIGTQPFGGEGLSGTGPKAGGPNYLLRLVAERTISVNTSAIGGNASLINLVE